MCSMEEQRKKLQGEGRQVEIDSEIFRKLIDETKELKVKTILFIGGEPLVRGDIFELVRYAREKGINPILITNGTLLTTENIIKCLENGVDWLSISIDAASEEVFSKIRGENVLASIMQNVKKLNELKDARKSSFPKVVIVCTIMNDNLEELLDIVNLSRDIQASRILFQPVVVNNIDQTQRGGRSVLIPSDRIKLADESIDKLISYKKANIDNFDFIGNSLKHLRLMKKYFKGNMNYRDFPCYAGFNRVQVVQEGRVYFCVDQKKYKANFGDFKRDTLKELWYSKEARNYRKIIRGCKVPCLQLCSSRDEFVELKEFFQKKLFFRKEGK